MDVVNLFSEKNLEAYNFGPKFTGTVLELTKLFGAKHLGLNIETLDPKTFTCPYHWHEKEEELCIAIEGEAILRKNGEFRKVRPGDLIYHGTGPSSAHHMYNHTDKPFRYFSLSTKFPDEICEYPDSKKIMDKKTRTVTQNGIAVQYIKDEEDPSRYWPASALRGDVL